MAIFYGKFGNELAVENFTNSRKRVLIFKHCRKFSKAISMAIFCGKFGNELAFENFTNGRESEFINNAKNSHKSSLWLNSMVNLAMS